MREYVKLSVEKKLKCDEDLATSSLSKQVAQLVTPISQKCLFSLSIGVLSTESRVTANSIKETFRAPTGRELSFE